MRHQLSGRQLSRNASHRHALMRNLAAALIRYESIRTTVPKAKELRRVVEPIITLGKKDTQHARQRAFSMLRDRELVEKLFTEVGPRFASRAGGYTRILKMEPRPGDSADMALMQLVEGAAQAEAPAADAKPKKKAAKKKAAPADAAAGEAPKKAPRKKKAAAA